MKRLFITAMLSIAVAGTALAADLPQPPQVQAPVAYIPTVAPVYNWGGIYVGINGGWGWGQSSWTVGPAGAFTPAVTGSTSDTGGLVGGTVGANFQADAFVFGVEGDWDYSGINTGTTGAVCSTFGTCQTGNNWLATARARVGYAADRVLFFGTAGGAFANMQTTYSGVQSSTTKAGWTAGAGVEWAFADNWTAKVEYLYIDLGTFNGNCSTAACTTVPGGTGGPVLPVSASLTENLIRAGVNFKFR
jgi:outer membrane immunogenic protein